MNLLSGAFDNLLISPFEIFKALLRGIILWDFNRKW